MTECCCPRVHARLCVILRNNVNDEDAEQFPCDCCCHEDERDRWDSDEAGGEA